MTCLIFLPQPEENYGTVECPYLACIYTLLYTVSLVGSYRQNNAELYSLGAIGYKLGFDSCVFNFNLIG